MVAHSGIIVQETFMCRAGLGERVIALLEERMCVFTEHTMKNVWSQPQRQVANFGCYSSINK